MFLNVFKNQIILGVITIILTWAIFMSRAMPVFFIFYNIFVLSVIWVGFSRSMQPINFKLSPKSFRRKIFWVAFVFRFVYMLWLLLLWYYYTDTPFSVEAIDALSFHSVAVKLADNLSWESLFKIKGFSLDDSLYPFLISFIYAISDNSVFLVRVAQVIVSSFSVVLLYDIIRVIDTDRRGRLSAIILAFAGSIVFYTGVHMKETLMVLSVFLSMRSGIYLLNGRRVLNNSLLLLLGLFFAIGTRFVLFFVLLSGFFVYTFFVNQTRIRRVSWFWKILIVLFFAGGSYFLVGNTTYGRYAKQQTSNLLGLEKKSAKIRTSQGRAKAFSSRSNLITTVAIAPITVPVSFLTPFPSITYTNINYATRVQQTEQWYHIGNILVLGLLSYFLFIGLFYLFKHKKYKSYSYILFTFFLYMAALIVSAYLTSIRFNIIKLVLIIPIIAYGIDNIASKHLYRWKYYTLLYCVLIVVWNYLKLARLGDV